MLEEYRRVDDKKNKSQAMICFGWLGPSIGSPDYAPMKVLNSILGGGMSARYFMNIRNKASLAYAANSVFPSRIDGGALAAIVGTDPKYVEKVRELILGEIKDILENGVSNEELDRSISFVSGQFALDHGICIKQAHYLSWFESIGVGFEYDGKYPKEVKAVKAEDIKRVAVKYLNPAAGLMAVTGP
jgi:zinc protease